VRKKRDKTGRQETGDGRPETGDRRRETGDGEERELEMGQKISKFEDLEVWKEGMTLAAIIYRKLKDCRDYSLRDQMQRAAVSIPSNIAEGYDRNTNKDFIHFLYISKASCSELRTQLYLAKEIGILSNEISDDLIELTRKISAMLYNYIKVRTNQF